MTDQYVQVNADGVGKKVDTTELTVGANTVERQRIHLAGGAADELADVKNAAPSISAYGLVARTIPIAAATPAQSSVTASATNVTLLSANTSRLGATIYNDADKALYVKLGATASTTSFTAKLAPKDATNNIGGYFEVPYGFTGQIDGIWDASPTGSARITELT